MNAAYRHPFDAGRTVRVKDGRYAIRNTNDPDGPFYRESIQVLPETFTPVDFDADGSTEAAVLYVCNGGGTGIFVYLAVFSSARGRIENIGFSDIGDRVSVQQIWAEGDAVLVEAVVQGPDDPLCCPSEPATFRFSFDAQKRLAKRRLD